MSTVLPRNKSMRDLCEAARDEHSSSLFAVISILAAFSWKKPQNEVYWQEIGEADEVRGALDHIDFESGWTFCDGAKDFLTLMERANVLELHLLTLLRSGTKNA